MNFDPRQDDQDCLTVCSETESEIMNRLSDYYPALNFCSEDDLLLLAQKLMPVSLKQDA